MRQNLEKSIDTYMNFNQIPASSKDKAFDRFEYFRNHFEQEQDDTGLEVLDELAKLACQYIEATMAIENKPPWEKESMGLAERQIEYREADTRKKRTHEALMAQISITNRYIFKNVDHGKVPEGGVYSLNPTTISSNDRHAMADWAGHLVLGLYAHRDVANNYLK